MSRIGRLPVTLPNKVKVQIKENNIEVSGPLGTLKYDLPEGISAALEENKVVLKRTTDDKKAKSLHGLARSLVHNMVQGVAEGYQKSLDVIGTGYRASMEGNNINIQVGLSHPVLFPVPSGIKVELEQTKDKMTRIKITGADKQLVGEIAANIRKVRLPEPYQGKGIRYTDEHIRRKVGKTTA
jgi:large subunit ribosomal protein L6